MTGHDDSPMAITPGGSFRVDVYGMAAHDPATLGRGRLTIERCVQRDGTSIWAVRDGCGFCLTDLQEWEHEPIPSSRSDVFLSRCRWSSAVDAAASLLQRLERGEAI